MPGERGVRFDIRIVEDESGITMSDSLERKLNSMCNLSQGIIERTATRSWYRAMETDDKPETRRALPGFRNNPRLS